MITKERLEEIESYWNDETNDEETQKWRDELTEEEEKFVNDLDKGYNKGIERAYAAIGKIIVERKLNF